MSAPASLRKFAFPAFGLVFAALGAAYGGPNAGALMGTIASSLSWLGGVMGNRTDALLFDEPTEPGADEVFRNHHLRALLRRTIEIIVQRAHSSRSASAGTATDILREAATTLGQAFCAELDGPDGAFQTLDEFHVPDILTAFAEKQGDVDFLTPEVWLAFIDRHVAAPDKTETKRLGLWQSERTALASALHTQFGTALWNLVKEDAAQDNRAFAAVQLLYFARILEAVENRPNAPDTSALTEQVETLIASLDARQSQWFQRLWQQSERHQGANMEAHRKTQWLLQVLIARSQPSPCLPSAPHTLRPIPTGFVGRTADLAVLRARSDQPTVLIGLRGMGGIGKTALGLVLAHEWTPRFPDAQLMLDGQGTQPIPASPESLLTQVIAAFHPDAEKNLPSDLASLQTLYSQVLHGKRILILLDNAKDTAQARPLVPPAGCALIVTSRQKILLGTQPPHDVGRLPDNEATALLREFYPVLGDADAATLVKLCAGLPLALRLAGSHLALDGDAPAYLKALGSGRLAALDAEAPDAGEVTISETFRLSENQLTPAQRTAWRALGIFQHSFDVRAAFAVARFPLPVTTGDDPEPPSSASPPQETENESPPTEQDLQATANLLTILTRRSLLEKVGDRYQLHDLAVEYVHAQLGEATCDNLRLAHARHYTRIGDEADNLYMDGKPVHGLALFDAEGQQIEAAYEWLRARTEGTPHSLSVPTEDERGRVAFATARQLIALVGAICYTSSLRFHSRQLIAWLATQARAACVVRDPAAEGRALCNLGLAHYSLGDARKAIELYEQALAISREIGDRCCEGNALGNLGIAHAELGDARKAIELYEQALVISREIGNRRGEGNDLGNLGIAHYLLGDARTAIEFHEQALVISREIGNRRGEGNDLGNLGIAHAELGDARKAIELYEQALAISREIGDRCGEGNALGNLGNAHAALGDARQAIKLYEQALVIYREIGNRRGEGSILGKLGIAHYLLGDARTAIEFHEQALVISREIGNRRAEGQALGNLDIAHADLGDARKAIELYEQALVIARKIGDRRSEGSDMYNSADELMKLGERTEALNRAWAALVNYEAIESPTAPKVRETLALWEAEG